MDPVILIVIIALAVLALLIIYGIVRSKTQLESERVEAFSELAEAAVTGADAYADDTGFVRGIIDAVKSWRGK